MTHSPLTLRPAIESLCGDTRRLEISEGDAVTVGGGTVTVGGDTVIDRVVVAAALPLQYAVWPVNTMLVEQSALSITVA